MNYKIFVFIFCLSLGYSQIGNSQVAIDTTIKFPADSPYLKLDDFTKGFKGQLKGVNDAAKKVQKNLIEKISSFFKFSSNFKEAEKKRIIDIVGALGIEDSIKLSEAKIKLLINQLSKTENQHYDTLLKLISAFKTVNIPSVPLTKEEAIAEEESANKTVKDNDVDNLTSKILSIVTKKANESVEDKNKREKLSETRSIISNEGKVHYVVDSPRNVIRKFIVNAVNSVKVIGFYNHNQNIDIDNYNFRNYNNIIYNGLFIDNTSGHIKNLNGWDDAPIFFELDQKNIKPILNLIFPNKQNFSELLLNNTKKENLIKDLIYLLSLHNSEGLCLQIDEPDVLFKKDITQFIISIKSAFLEVKKDYKMYLIIPSANNNPIFEFTQLNKFIDYYIVDFFQNGKNPIRMPLAPLKGKELSSIESSFSYFTNVKIPSSKLILGLASRGNKWTFNNRTKDFKFLQSLTYAEIRKRYDWPIVYDEETASALMDSLDAKGDLKCRIYFEDENTLGKKFDFVLQNKIAGVSIYAAGFDYGYGDINDMIVYKLSKIDTLYIEDSIINNSKKYNFFQKLSMRWKLYAYILDHPCEVCFDNISDLDLRSELFNYVKALEFDKRAEEDKISRFQYVTKSLNEKVQICFLIFLILSIILIYFYIKKVRDQGDDLIKDGKSLYLINLVSWFMVLIFLFLMAFTSDIFPYFGIINAKKEVYIMQKNKSDTTSTKKEIDSTSKSNDTKIEKNQDNNEPKQANKITKIDDQATTDQIQLNAERTASNDAIKEVKNKYLNSSLRIIQNSKIRNQSKTENPSVKNNSTNNDNDQNNEVFYTDKMTYADSIDYKNDKYCVDELRENTSGCINMPCLTLLTISLIAITIGVLFDILFIRRLTQKNEIP